MCKNNCKLCDRLIISQSVTFAGGVLIVDLPAGSYANGCDYCIVVAQSIPAAATITAPVAVTIGGGTVQYPLVKQDCAQAAACSIRTRTRYPVRVSTTPAGGSFKLRGRLCCAPSNALASINGTAPAAAPAAAGVRREA